MRMWMVDPALMCDQHLLGEHVETHMFVGAINKGKGLAGYIANRLVETHNLRLRHNELAREMARRGMRHRSPLPAFRAGAVGLVCRKGNLEELARRCPECRKKQEGLKKRAA